MRRTLKNLKEIIPGELFTSGRPHILPTELRIKKLKEREISVVVNLWKYPDAELLRAGFHYIYFPIPDGKSWLVDVKQMSQFFSLADRSHSMLLQKRKILIHCYGGVDRSVFLAALVYRRWAKVSGGEALAWILCKYPGALKNAYFRQVILNQRTF